MRGNVAQLALLRWEFDVARSPDSHSGQGFAVWREPGDVLVVHDRRGEVLNRYALRRLPGAFLDPARLAYELLQEL